MGDGLVCLIDPGRQPINVLTSMFLHGSWMHLLGNMWFLWLFGNNIEDAMSRLRFVVFYLLCGLAAALLQVVVEPASAIPMVGASGAISGVMGAYLVLFPRVRVFTLVPLGFILTTIALPAWAMLIYWMVLQLAGGFVKIGGEPGGGVAFWAHVGGFIAGVGAREVVRAAGSPARPSFAPLAAGAHRLAVTGIDARLAALFTGGQSYPFRIEG